MKTAAITRAMSPKTANVINEYRSRYETTISQASPANLPRWTRMVFQIRVPKMVSGRKTASFILAMPAGIDTKLLTMGTNRHRNTACRCSD